jgi:uncharacterized membrane protein
MGPASLRLLIPAIAVIPCVAFAQTFESMTEVPPPNNLNAPVGAADDGRVVGHGTCSDMGDSWCRVPNGEISFYRTPGGGFEQIDWGIADAVDLEPNQGLTSLKIIDASANLDYLTGNYWFTTFGPNGGSYSYPGRAFRWSRAGGFEALWPHEVDDGFLVQAMSADGAAVVGFVGNYYGDWTPRYTDPPRAGGRAARWTPGGGVEELGVPAFAEGSIATLVSADGSAIAGKLQYFGGIVTGFYWTTAQGVIGLGDLPGGQTGSSPVAMSNDGKVVVGSSWSAVGSEPFRWDATNGMMGLGFLPTSQSGSATAVSADGSTVVGYGTDFGSGNSSRAEAWIWTAAGGMRSLGVLPGGSSSTARYVSPDGSLVIGTSGRQAYCQWFGCADEDLFVWTEATGMRGVRDMLIAHGYDLSDWNSFGVGASSISISPNGKTIAVGTLHVSKSFSSTGPSPYDIYEGAYGSYQRGYVVQLDKLAAKIDVQPWSPLNQIDPDATGTIPVALLARTGTGPLDSNFDISKVDMASLRFGAGAAPAVVGPLNGVDFDADSRPDVAYAFSTFDAAIACGDTEVTLTGATTDGHAFVATDTIETVECETNTCHP